MRRIVSLVVFAALAPLAALAAPAVVVPGVYLLRGAFVPGTQPDGNTVMIAAPDGWIVVDTGRHAEHTRAIVAFAHESKRPVAAIINTHWHLDHIGGNALLRREFPGVRVYASGALANARKGFLANYRKQLEPMVGKMPGAEAEIALIDAADALAPDVVIAESSTRVIAGRELAVHLEHDAVTEGDVWLVDRATGVVVAGDLVTLPAPFLDTAVPKRWGAVLDRMASSEEFALVIPGHGAPLTRRQFARYRDAFSALIACGASDVAQERCVDAWLAAVAPIRDDGDDAFARSLTAYYVGLLRAPAMPRVKGR